MKRDNGVDLGWIQKRAKKLIPLVDRLNHIGAYVSGLEEISKDVDVSDMLAGVEDLLSQTLARVAKSEDLPFTESTFRNYLRRYPAFEHRLSSRPDMAQPAQDDDSLAQTTKLMSWLQIQ